MTVSTPSLNTLRAFEAVARHLNYHSAAEELNVTPAAVKQLVSRLEESIGTPLLKRKGRGLVLTPTGEAGLNDLSLGMNHLKRSVEKMREDQGTKPVIISVEPSFSSAWLVSHLADFRQQHPQVNVLIDSSAHIVDLQNQDIDIAIRYGIQSRAPLISHRLFDDQIMPACSPSVAESLPGHADLDQLNQLPLIHWDTSQLTGATSSRQWFVWENWLRHFDANTSASREGLHFSEYSQGLQAAIAGQGVILVSKPVVEDLFQSGLLVAPFSEIAEPDIGYDVVLTEAAAARPEVSAFVDWILLAVKPSHS